MDREIGIQAAKDYLHKKYIEREERCQELNQHISQAMCLILCMMVLFGMLIFA